MLAVCVICAAGCSGGGRIELASLNYRAIDPPRAPPPRAGRIDLDRCYWWSDEDGQVWIAMQCEKTPLLNPKLRFLFQSSLVLEKLPAGPALDYKVTKNTLRAQVRLGPWESRFTSQVGVVALYRESNDRLRGSVRLQATRVTTRLLGGWGRPTRYLMLASFVAVHDQQRGRPIAEATESRGWGRDAAPTARRRSPPPQPTSGPADSPATTETKP